VAASAHIGRALTCHKSGYIVAYDLAALAAKLGMIAAESSPGR